LVTVNEMKSKELVFALCYSIVFIVLNFIYFNGFAVFVCQLILSFVTLKWNL
jgi:hypothetical protein